MSIVQNHPYIKGIALAVAGFTLFACSDAVIKTLSQSFNTYTIVFFNLLCSGLVFVALSPMLGGLRSTFKSKNLKWHIVRGVIFALQLSAIIYGFSHMSLAKTYALIFTSPFFTTILASLLLSEKVSPPKWGAILLGFSGVLIVLRPGLIPLGLPALVVLASAICFSFTNLIARRFGDNEPFLVLGLLPHIAALLMVSPLYFSAFELPALDSLHWLVIMGILSATGYLSLTMAFVYTPAAIAAPFHYVQIIWGVLFGYFFFGDMLDLWTGVGAATIISGGLLLIWFSRKEDEQTVPAQKDIAVGESNKSLAEATHQARS